MTGVRLKNASERGRRNETGSDEARANETFRVDRADSSDNRIRSSQKLQDTLYPQHHSLIFILLCTIPYSYHIRSLFNQFGILPAIRWLHMMARSTANMGKAGASSPVSSDRLTPVSARMLACLTWPVTATTFHQEPEACSEASPWTCQLCPKCTNQRYRDTKLSLPHSTRIGSTFHEPSAPGRSR